jgi:hypothetical protein
VGLLVAGMSSYARRLTGAGVWSLPTAVTLAVVLVTSTSLVGVLTRHVAPTCPLGLAVLGLLGAAFAPVRRFDVYATSAAALGLVTLLVAGLGRFMFEGPRGDPISNFFFVGIAAAGLLAGAVSLVLRWSRAAAAVADEQNRQTGSAA